MQLQLVNGLHSKNIRGDLFGGITAAVVALPLALAFGVSSGAGAIAGLYGAIIVGFFAALFGGTPSQISGPTGPMTVVIATVFSTEIARDPENGAAIAFTVIIVSGIFQIVFGIMRLGKYITLMPYTVISGFMSGIGAIIILLQLGPFFGHPASANVVESVSKLPYFLSNANLGSVELGILTLVIVFFTPAKITRLIPSPLLALIMGTFVAINFLPDQGLRLIGDIPSGLPSLHLPSFNIARVRDIFGYGLMLAVLGSIDSLLTSLVADNITQTQHDSDRELIGQGIGNLLAGLCGGLPGAGATMRTVINVKSGGKTPISGMIHALVLLTIVLKAGELTSNIPQTVLAGILIKVGIDIIDWSFIRRAHKISIKATGLMYMVLFLTVFVDLITAVAAGVFFANLLTIKSLSDIQSGHVRAIVNHDDDDDDAALSMGEKHLLKQARGKILLFNLSGPMSFGAAKTISQRMGIVRKYEVLILDLSDVPLLGVTASLAIENMIKDACANNHQVFLVGAKGKVKRRLQNMKLLRLLAPDHCFDERLFAIQEAIAYIESPEIKFKEVKKGNRPLA
ncbi:MAG: SulP family inorganic anion transporter [Pleurocapsa sp.]